MRIKNSTDNGGYAMNDTQSFLKRTWAEIDLDALEYNLNHIRAYIGNKEIIAVVKANAYGHDDSIICRALYHAGVTHFAVSNLWEGEDLRALLPDAEILVFGYTEENQFHSVLSHNLILAVGDVAYAKSLSDYALSHHTNIRVHIKINTGMTRVGLDTKEEFEEILSLSGLSCEAAFTHFASADSEAPEDIRFTDLQQQRFLSIVGDHPIKLHSMNSGGIMYHKDYRCDYVRAGIILYGYRPNADLTLPFDIKPVLTLKSVVTQVKTVPKGTDVSYGRTYTTACERTLAVIPVGYADGYSRHLSNQGSVILHGKPARITGRVCMDQIIVDVTDIPEVKVGDVALVYSGDYPETNIDSIAKSLDTVGYELICAVGHRIPRIAVKGGKVVDVVRYL
jgi:alanine racemase